MRHPLTLAVIYGSTRPGRFCDTVADWAVAEIARDGRFAPDMLDPAAADFPRDAHELKDRLARADAFLVVTPEYNHSYPAPLKALIDQANAEWAEKPVAFVSYGGISGGLRAVEHLRNVFAELGAHTLRDTVSFANAWSLFDEAGALKAPEAPRKAASALFNGLDWWARALKVAREAREIEGAAA